MVLKEPALGFPQLKLLWNICYIRWLLVWCKRGPLQFGRVVQSLCKLILFFLVKCCLQCRWACAGWCLLYCAFGCTFVSHRLANTQICSHRRCQTFVKLCVKPHVQPWPKECWWCGGGHLQEMGGHQWWDKLLACDNLCVRHVGVEREMHGLGNKVLHGFAKI